MINTHEDIDAQEILNGLPNQMFWTPIDIFFEKQSRDDVTWYKLRHKLVDPSGKQFVKAGLALKGTNEFFKALPVLTESVIRIILTNELVKNPRLIPEHGYYRCIKVTEEMIMEAVYKDRLEKLDVKTNT